MGDSPFTVALPGAVINGRYEIVRPIGKGATGEVFVAKDLSKTDQPIAIKYLKWLSGKTGALDQFKKEFETLTHLSHPHIAKVYDFEQDTSSRQFFFTSELVEGQEFLQAARNLSVEKIEELFVQALRALEYLHGNKIFHFDIKSANVLVSMCSKAMLESGEARCAIKLIDFGLATLRFQGKLAGTPSYMSPEMIKRADPDNRSDLYSLGVLFYAALTGENPFRTANMEETLKRQLELVPDPPSLLNNFVPPHLDSVVMKLLEKNPLERYATAAEVIQDLSLRSQRTYEVETEETQQSYIPTDSAFIGRDLQLAAVGKLLDEKRSAVVIIRGERGSGKSRLLREIKNIAQIKEWKTSLLSDASILGEWRTFVSSIGNHPTLVAIDDFDRLYHELWGIAVRESACSIAKKINEDGTSAPLLLVFTSDRWTTFPYPIATPDTVVIALEDFTADELAKYLTTLTGVQKLPHDFAGEIWQNTHGNPLLVSELARAFVASKQLVDSMGRWKESTFEDIKLNLGRLDLSQLTKSQLLEGFDELSTPAKELAYLMAVAGRPIDEEALFELFGRENPAFAREELFNAGFASSGTSVNEMFFRKPLTAKAVYDLVPKAVKMELHDIVAGYLAKNGNATEEELLHHSGRGKDPAKAKISLQKLIETQTQRQLNWHAISSCRAYLERWNEPRIKLDLAKLYNRTLQPNLAIRLAGEVVKCGDPTLESRALEIIGISHLKKNSFEAARRHFLAAIQIADKLPLPSRLRLDNFLAEVDYFTGRFESAIAIYERTASLAERKLSREEQLKVKNNNLGECYFRRGLYQQAIERLKADIINYRDARENRLIAKAQYLLAESYRLKKDFDAAFDNFIVLIEYAKSVNDLDHLFRAYNGIGSLFSDQGRLEEAAGYFERALDIARRLGSDEQAIVCVMNLGIIAADSGELKKAKDYFVATLAFLEKTRGRGGFADLYRCQAHLELSDVYRRDKNFQEALKHVFEALKLAQKPAASDMMFWAIFTRAKIAADAKDETSRLKYFCEAEQLANTSEKRSRLKEIS